MGGSGPKTPSASETGAQNRETAKYNTEMSFVDQYTPQGSYVYSQLPGNKVTKSERYISGYEPGSYDREGYWQQGAPIYQTRTWEETDPNAAPRYKLDVNLSPSELAKQQGLDDIQLALLGLGQNQIGRVQQSVSQPFDWSGARQITADPTAKPLDIDFAKMSTVGGLKDMKMPEITAGNASNLPSSTANAINAIKTPTAMDPSKFNLQQVAPTVAKTNYDYLFGGKVNPTISNTDYTYLLGGEDARQKAAESAYKYLTYGYDDRYGSQQSDMENMLASQGIRPGTQAYNQALRDFNTGKNEAYERAELQAYNTGLNEYETQFRQRFDTAGLGLQAQQALFDQMYKGSDLAFNQQYNAAGLGLNAQQALFDQRYKGNDLYFNQNRGLQNDYYNQGMGLANFGLGAQQAIFGQNKDVAEFGRLDRQDKFQQEQKAAEMEAQRQQAIFQQQQQIAQMEMQKQAQEYSQQLQQMQAESSLRQQQIQEQAYARQLPLNELSALISGTQVQGPQFTPVSTAQTPYMPYFQPQAGNNWTSDLIGLGGSFVQGGMSMMSSRKIKEDKRECEPVLEKVRALPVERWKYVSGVADEGQHIGPYAEDWAEAFGGPDTHINSVDAIGVCLKAIQELSDKVDALESKNEGVEDVQA